MMTYSHNHHPSAMSAAKGYNINISSDVMSNTFVMCNKDQFSIQKYGDCVVVKLLVQDHIGTCA